MSASKINYCASGLTSAIPHVRPYGEVNLNMAARLNLTAATVSGQYGGRWRAAEELTDA
ncbi:hypothetical protein ACFYW6_17735 [Streptomyces sp. NPDC002659]|uniref:hypothetical protein n=1 Tax=Streptomyces sp. NPDC002659 TaxID=3364656 RepID=UPI0036A2902D